MAYSLIGTWKMALDGVRAGEALLRNGHPVRSAIEAAVSVIEDDPRFVSVGYGGLPNLLGQVELDAAYMDGGSLRFGAIMGVHSIQNPIRVAAALSERRTSCVLVGLGAERFAEQNGYAMRNMLTDAARQSWLAKLGDKPDYQCVKAYDGHDTVCMIGFDQQHRMAAGVSTSGLFLKDPGRVGDTPIIGCGFYCDTRFGGAVATGNGEDIMRGCLAYAIVSGLRAGQDPQTACETALNDHLRELAVRGYDGAMIGVLALAPDGRFGAACSLERFAFAVANPEGGTRLLFAVRDGNATRIVCGDDEEAAYTGD